MQFVILTTNPISLICQIGTQVGTIIVIWGILNALDVSGLSTSNSLSISLDNDYKRRKEEYGLLETLRIAHGTDVEPGQYQSIGLLFSDKADICSAVLVSPSVGLCGCHCLIKENWYDWKYPQVLMEPEKIALLIECVDLSNPRGQMRAAKELRVHRECSKNETKVTYNYGLIRFSEPFLEVFDYIETMELPNYQTPALIDQMIQNEEPCIVVGWTPQYNVAVSNRMKEFRAKLRHHDWCAATVHYLTEHNEEGPDYYLPDHQICVSTLQEGTSGCFGDNIGPLLCGVGDKFIIGIFSFVPRADICGSSELPTVGSRLDLVSGWIHAFLKEEDVPLSTGMRSLSCYYVISLSILIFFTV